MEAPNYRVGVDAGLRLAWHFGVAYPGTTHHGRSPRDLGIHSIKQKRTILSLVGFGLAFAAVCVFLPRNPSGPASVSFLGFTNPPTGSEEARATGGECEALF